jgi:rfaE bifunctional protein kinase chain/domain
MKSLRELFEDIRVLVIGDTMIDRYLYGNVDRISPEAPVPILRRTRKEDRPGGAANVALNAAELGMEVGICSVHGKDEQGDHLREISFKSGLKHQFWTESEDRPTTQKTRVIARQQQLLRVDFEESFPLCEKEQLAFEKRMEDAFTRFKPEIVILQDYNKGVLSQDSIAAALRLANQNNCFIAVDPKLKNFRSYRSVDLFKPNLSEFRTATLWSGEIAETDFHEIAGSFIDSIQARHLFITLSEHGIYHLSENGKGGIVPTASRSIVDVCGAGDAVIAVAAAALYSGMSPMETARLCNIAGGQVCERVGVSPVEIDALEREYQSGTK